jgi:hypothetical protein
MVRSSRKSRTNKNCFGMRSASEVRHAHAISDQLRIIFYLGYLALVALPILNSFSSKSEFLCLRLTSVAYDHI